MCNRPLPRMILDQIVNCGECADSFYHSLVLLAVKKLTLMNVEAELDRRQHLIFKGRIAVWVCQLCIVD